MNFLWKKKKPIVAQFAVYSAINRDSYIKLVKAVSKADLQKKEVKAVAFVVNSPGGSPVYSSLMGQRVAAFAKNRKIPLYTFAEDYAASGGYWLLCMGDHVYSHPTSLVGSIGVISPTFALKGILDKNKIGYNEIATSQNLLEQKFDSIG